jgi:cytochrome c2
LQSASRREYDPISFLETETINEKPGRVIFMRLFSNITKVVEWIGLLLGVCLLAACGAQGIDPGSIGDVERGREIFTTGAGILGEPCASCHSLDGSPREGEAAGPTLLGIAETAAGRVSGQGAVEYLHESIIDPGEYIVRGYRNDMEAGYKYLLSEQDIDDLVAFMLTQ